MSHKLHLALPNLKNHAARLGFSLTRGQRTLSDRVVSIKNYKSRQAKKDEKREAWILLLEKHPSLKIRDLIEQNKYLIEWLRANDRQWFEEHSLLRENATYTKNTSNQALDNELYVELTETYRVIQNYSSIWDKPFRITMTKMFKLIGRSRNLLNRLDDSSLTKRYLIYICETHEKFAMRRIRISIWRYFERNKIPSFTQFVLDAGIFSGIKQKPKRLIAVYNALNEIKQFVND